MRKIFIDDSLVIGQNFKLRGKVFDHLKVLRLKEGDLLAVGTGDNKEFVGKVISKSRDHFTLKIKARTKNIRRPLRQIVLYVALPKKDKLEDVVYKCSQIGINEFVPFISSRTIKRPYKENFAGLKKRLYMKSCQGAEISRREQVPLINDILFFDEALEDFNKRKFEKGLILWEEAEASDHLITRKDFCDNMAVFIGPEGGFDKSEIDLAIQNNLEIRSLGPLLLSAETASVSVSALLLCQ